MEDLQASEHMLRVVQKALSHYDRPYDPNVDYKVLKVFAPEDKKFHDVVRRINEARGHVLFSAMNAERQAVRQSVEQKQKFPAGAYCSLSFKVAMQYIKGSRGGNLRPGDSGLMFVLKDPQPEEVSSPSVVHLGKSKLADQQRSYRESSTSVEIIAAVYISVTRVGPMSVTSSSEEEIAIEIGHKVSERLKRKLKKVKRKRMDNFGLKED